MRIRHLGLLVGVAAVLLSVLGVAAQPVAFPVALTSPTNGASLPVAGGVFNLKAEASSSNSVITRVQFYVDGVLIGEDTGAPYSVFWSNIVAGLRSLTAVAEDAAEGRATSAVVTVFVLDPSRGTLTWTAAQTREWNNVDLNWNASVPFADGSSVIFDGTAPGRVFIGLEGTPFNVAPTQVTVYTPMIFDGGDITGGSLLVQGGGVTLSNASGRYSFPGGSLITSFGSINHDVSRAGSNATVHAGTGPIQITSGIYGVRGTAGQRVEVTNDFVITGSGTISASTYSQEIALRNSGALRLQGSANYSMSGGNTNLPNEWSGPWIIGQSNSGNRFFQLNGVYQSKSFMVSGNISDDLGMFSNPLSFSVYAVPKLVIAGSNNTYNRGTLIRNSPSAPKGVVEVAPHSSLGLGNVEVQGGGVLALTGDSNIVSTASVRFDGQVEIAHGVKVRVAQAIVGGQSYSRALLSSNTHPFHLPGRGSLRVGTVNEQPSVTFSNIGAPNYAGGDIPVRVTATDRDSYLTGVELFVNETLVAATTNSSLLYFLTNVPTGTHVLRARAFDDDGAESTNIMVNVTVSVPPFPPGVVIWNDSGAWGREWNTRVPNWARGVAHGSYFISGDETWFNDERPGRVFIGQGGSPLEVRPSRVLIDSQFDYHFSGGRISGAPIEKAGTGTATFSNYNASFDAPSVLVRGGTLEFGQKNLAFTGGFGRGDIIVSNGTFRWKPVGSSFEAPSFLTNRLVILGTNSTIGQAPIQRAKCVWTGGISFGQDAALSIVTALNSGQGVGQHEFGGRIELFGTNLVSRFGGHSNTALAFTGDIVDGPSGAGALVISNSQNRALRITGPSNTWSGGTIIAALTNAFLNPSNTDHAIEVAAGSRLGTGRVLVESNALLLLLGPGTVAHDQRLDVQGSVYLPSNIVVNVAQLQLGPVLHTDGAFTHTNGGGHLFGGGWIYVGALTNEPPTILAQPLSQTGSLAGSAAFVVVAGGVPALGFQWQKDGTNLPNTQAATLLLTNLTRLLEGAYRVIVTNDAGSVLSSNAFLRLAVPQRINSIALNPVGGPRLEFSDAVGGGLANPAYIGLLNATNLLGAGTIWFPVTNGTIALTNGILRYDASGPAAHVQQFFRIIER
jgi:hypothetical protein